MKLRALIFSLSLAVLGSQVMAGTPTSGNVAPVVLIAETVDVNGNVLAPAGSTSGIGMAGTGFGQSTPKANLPQSANASLSYLMMPAFNPVSSGCPAGALTAGCVLAGAATWIAANQASLQTRIGQFEGSFGYSFAWFSYSQSIQLTGENTTRTLTWSMFVNAQGVGTYGAPQLSGGTGAVLYVRYASLSAPAGVAPSWVIGLNPNAGMVQWQLLDTTLTPIQCADLTAAGCTLNVNGAFDEPLTDFSGTTQTSINAGYNALLGPGAAPSFSYTPTTAAATVQALLAKTGASYALVDYGYTLLPQYATVSDGFCPNGAPSCARAVGQYTYTALRIDLCTCGTDNYVNTGSYSLSLQYQIARNVVSASTNSDGTSTMGSNLLEQFGYTMQSPSIAFNASGANNAGSWVLPITHAQALAVLSAATPQVLLPTDGSKLVDAAALLTPPTAGQPPPSVPSVVINGVSNASASTLPVSLPAVTTTGSDILYWSANPIPGVANTYLAVEARCDANSNTQFIAGYNFGAVEATDSNPNGGFINPTWGSPQQANPANTFLTGSAICAGAGTEIDVPNSTYATVQYFYASSPSCTTLEGTEGPGDVCPAAYTWTSITDPNGDSTGESVCLNCASGSPSAVNNNGNISYSCSTGGSPTQLSSLYEVPLNGGGTTCSQSSTTPAAPQTNSSYSWAAGPWPVQAPNCAWETRVVACVDQTGAVVSNEFCTGPQPIDAQFTTNGCGYVWQAGNWSAPSSTCSLSATETRSVVCVRGDGSTMPDSFCAGQTKPDTSQTLAVSSGCPYQWALADWGSCTGGTFGWQYSAWAPPSVCGEVTQESRTATGCSATPDSGSASRSVTCVKQSDGTTVANSNCAGLPALGSQPSPTETCTPQVTGNSQCGVPGPLSQNSSLTDGCFGISFKWVQSGFGGCTGGTAAWQYTDWAPFVPASGCGVFSQTRNGSCTQTLNSGTATQSISCVGNDGKTYPNGVCSALVGAAPPTSEACTPTAVSCGTEAVLTQNVTLTDQCRWAAGAWSACAIRANTCPEGSHPQSGCGDPYLPFHVGNPAWNSSWVSDDAQGIPASELNFCANGSFLTPGLPWDNRSIMGATGDWCYDNSTGGFIAPTKMSDAATQTRSVTCQAPNGTVVSNTLCAGVSPAVSQPCTSCMSYENHVFSAAEWTVGEQDLWDTVSVCTDGTSTTGAQQTAVVNGGWLGGASGGGGIPGSLWNVSPWVPATSCPAGYTQQRTVYCAGSFNVNDNSTLINVYPDSLCLTDPTYIVLGFDGDGNAIMGFGPPVPKPAQCR